MKHYTHLFSRNDEFERFVEKLDIANEPEVLIQVFCGIISLAHINELQTRIKGLLPKAKIIGCTTAGEILGDNVYEHSTVISISVFKHTKVQTCITTTSDPFVTGKQLAEKLKAKDLVTAICLLSGSNENELVAGQPYIDGFNSVCPDIPVVGGVGGDNAMFMQSYVFDDEKIITDGMVGAGLYSDKLKITSTFNLGWRPIGRKFIVTEAEGNVIKTLDGKPAADLINKYFGSFIKSGHGKGMNFPLYTTRAQIRIARGILEVNDDGSVRLSGPLHTGEKVRLSYGGADIIIKNCKKLIPQWERITADAIFMYSCACRKWSLPHIVDQEVKMFFNGTPTIGFFSYGEFFYSGNCNECLNYTQTLVALEEYETPVKHKYEILLNNNDETDDGSADITEYQVDDKHQYLQVLDHLVGVMNHELLGLNKLLEQRNEQLKKSLEQIKTIQGLLPICSHCKKIRNDDGYWQEVEAYFREHTDAVFSHGVCPDCFRKLYPEMDFEKVYELDAKKLRESKKPPEDKK